MLIDLVMCVNLELFCILLGEKQGLLLVIIDCIVIGGGLWLLVSCFVGLFISVDVVNWCYDVVVFFFDNEIMWEGLCQMFKGVFDMVCVLLCIVFNCGGLCDIFFIVQGLVVVWIVVEQIGLILLDILVEIVVVCVSLEYVLYEFGSELMLVVKEDLLFLKCDGNFVVFGYYVDFDELCLFWDESCKVIV